MNYQQKTIFRFPYIIVFGLTHLLFSCYTYRAVPCGSLSTRIDRLVPGTNCAVEITGGIEFDLNITRSEGDRIVGREPGDTKDLFIDRSHITNVTIAGDHCPVEETLPNVILNKTYSLVLSKGDAVTLKVSEVNEKQIAGSSRKGTAQFSPRDIKEIREKVHDAGKSQLLLAAGLFAAALIGALTIEL